MPSNLRGTRQIKVADPFYQSARWRKLRTDILKRDNFKCRDCGFNSPDGSYLQVDHVMERKDYPAGAYLRENLRTLCRPCHTAKTFGFNARLRPEIGPDGFPVGGDW